MKGWVKWLCCCLRVLVQETLLRCCRFRYEPGWWMSLFGSCWVSAITLWRPLIPSRSFPVRALWFGTLGFPASHKCFQSLQDLRFDTLFHCCKVKRTESAQKQQFHKLSIVTSTTCGDFLSAAVILSSISIVTPVCPGWEEKVCFCVDCFADWACAFESIPGPKATVVMLVLYGSASKIVQYSSCAPSAVIPEECVCVFSHCVFFRDCACRNRIKDFCVTNQKGSDFPFLLRCLC